MMFNGNRDLEELSGGTNYWYEGTDREKSLELALEYSNDTVLVFKDGISRDVCTGYRIKNLPEQLRSI